METGRWLRCSELIYALVLAVPHEYHVRYGWAQWPRHSSELVSGWLLLYSWSRGICWEDARLRKTFCHSGCHQEWYLLLQYILKRNPEDLLHRWYCTIPNGKWVSYTYVCLDWWRWSSLWPSIREVVGQDQWKFWENSSRVATRISKSSNRGPRLWLFMLCLYRYRNLGTYFRRVQNRVHYGSRHIWDRWRLSARLTWFESVSRVCNYWCLLSYWCKRLNHQSYPLLEPLALREIQGALEWLRLQVDRRPQNPGKLRR